MGPVNIMFLACLAVQVGIQPILARRYVDSQTHGATLVLAAESVKLLVCLAVLYGQDGGKTVEKERKKWTLKSSILGAGLPAVVYAIQNSLVWVAYNNLSGLSFNLINQSKIMFTAVFVFLLLGKRQTGLQVVALVLLLSATLVATSGKEREAREESDSFLHGVVPLFIASALSGLAASLCQYTLQGTIQRNSLVFSMELAVYSSTCIVIRIVCSLIAEGNQLQDLVVGWSRWTFIPVLVQGLGGIVVGQVTKRAGGVLKGFAIGSGLLLTAVMEHVLGLGELEEKHLLGLALVMLSLFLYNRESQLVAAKAKAKAKEKKA